MSHFDETSINLKESNRSREKWQNCLQENKAKEWLRENNLKDEKSIETAFIAEIKDVLHETLEKEMSATLGYSKYDWKNQNVDNSRNDFSKKTVKSQFGNLALNIPRNSNGKFEPIIIKKHEISA